MNKDLELLHKKIDFLTEQVMITQRRQRELEELKQDLIPVASDVLKSAVEELDEVAPYFTADELLYLGKKLLRNTRNLIAFFEQMEGAADFIKDAAPLTKSMFQTTLEKLDEYDRKGYFVFLKGAAEIIDRVVTSFGEEDVRHLGENVVLILNTVKQLTQPEMLDTIQNALSVYKNLNVATPDSVSLFSLIRQLNDPKVRRALATGLAIMKNISATIDENRKTLAAVAE